MSAAVSLLKFLLCNVSHITSLSLCLPPLEFIYVFLIILILTQQSMAYIQIVKLFFIPSLSLSVCLSVCLSPFFIITSMFIYILPLVPMLLPLLLNCVIRRNYSLLMTKRWCQKTNLRLNVSGFKQIYSASSMCVISFSRLY